MIEILNILFIIFFSSILFSNVLIGRFFAKKMNISNLSFIKILSINLLFLLIILLILSFFKVNLIYIVLSYFLLSVLSQFSENNYFKKKFSNDFLFGYILFVLISFILSIDIVSNPKLEWDGHSWYFHALNFKESLNFFNLESLPRSEQPHLGGLIWGLFWKLSILDYETYGRIAYIIIYTIAILSVCENISKNKLVKITVTAILIILTYDRYLFSGYQEVLIFSLIIIISNFIQIKNVNKFNFFYLLFILSSTSLILWTKNEGIFFFIILLGYILYFHNLRDKIFILLFVFVLIFLKFYLVHYNVNIISLSHDFSFSIATENIAEKIILLIKHILISLIKYPIWILFCFLLLFENNLKKKIDVIYFSLSSIFFLILIYLLHALGLGFEQDVNQFEWLLTGSLDRMIFQFSGFLILFVSNSLSFILSSFKNQ